MIPLRRPLEARGDEDQRWHFKCDVSSHFRSPPETDGEAVTAEAHDDDQSGESNAGRGGIFQPLAEFVWSPPEEAC
jgi:hypothetical protein